MAGYWNRPEDTAAVLTPDGWLRTGDAARPDEDGYIWIVGRVADSFISHGQVVHPGDVERILLSHPAVADSRPVTHPLHRRMEPSPGSQHRRGAGRPRRGRRLLRPCPCRRAARAVLYRH
jgi:AMP-binding enzyme